MASYRNDWAWDYVEALRGAGIDAAIYVATEGAAENVVSPDGVRVRFLPLGRAWTPWRVAPVLKRRSLPRAAAVVSRPRCSATADGPRGCPTGWTRSASPPARRPHANPRRS